MASSYSKLASYAVLQLLIFPFTWECQQAGPALADTGLNARPRRGAPLSSDFMTSSCCQVCYDCGRA